MGAHNADTSPGTSKGGRFVTTQWSLVAAAGGQTCAESKEALETLCKQYWYPLYAYIRHRGSDAHQAADLTQSFFTRLLERKMVRGADRDRGKFRSYLLGALKHFLADEWDRERAQKRGGGVPLVRLDVADAENRYCLEPATTLTPERLFEKRWALTLLDLTLSELRTQMVAEGKESQFDRLKAFLAGGSSEGYRAAGADLGLSEGAVKVLVHRLRRRYRGILHLHIRQTVALPGEVDEEIKHLFAAISE